MINNNNDQYCNYVLAFVHSSTYIALQVVSTLFNYYIIISITKIKELFYEEKYITFCEINLFYTIG